MSGSAQSGETSACAGVFGTVKQLHCFPARGAFALGGKVLDLSPPYLAGVW